MWTLVLLLCTALAGTEPIPVELPSQPAHRAGRANLQSGLFLVGSVGCAIGSMPLLTAAALSGGAPGYAVGSVLTGGCAIGGFGASVFAGQLGAHRLRRAGIATTSLGAILPVAVGVTVLATTPPGYGGAPRTVVAAGCFVAAPIAQLVTNAVSMQRRTRGATVAYLPQPGGGGLGLQGRW